MRFAPLLHGGSDRTELYIVVQRSTPHNAACDFQQGQARDALALTVKCVRRFRASVLYLRAPWEPLNNSAHFLLY